jgi:predicted DNA-binding ribbon-helix-helix protein
MPTRREVALSPLFFLEVRNLAYRRTFRTARLRIGMVSARRFGAVVYEHRVANFSWPSRVDVPRGAAFQTALRPLKKCSTKEITAMINRR